MRLTPKTASVVPPEDGRLTPETCRGLRHNEMIVKVKVYLVGYVTVIYNDTRSTKYHICLYAPANTRFYQHKHSLYLRTQVNRLSCITYVFLHRAL
jgi:hypothetical protein